MTFLGPHQEHCAAAGLMACLALMSSCASQEPSAVKEDRAFAFPSSSDNPLLRQFMAICSTALNDTEASHRIARDAGWKEFGPTDTGNRVFKLSGGMAAGGFDLFILTAPGSPAAAATCAVRGLYVSPALTAGFDRFDVPGYAATNESLASGVKRRLEGVASFGDPVRIELTSSTAQGASAIELAMTNLAKPMTAKPN